MKAPAIVGIIALLACGAVGYAQTSRKSTAPVASDASAAALSTADVAAIRAASKVYEESGNARDWRRTLSLFTEDIVWMPPHAPVVSGLKAVEAILNNYPAFKDLRLEPLDIEGRGDLAYVRGRYSLVMTPANRPEQPDSGKYIEIWRKQSNGTWKYARGIFNSDLPVADMAGTPTPDALLTGAWELNVAKSRFHPGPAPRSETRLYSVTADGRQHAIYDQIHADGRRTRGESTFALDGKDAPVTGMPDVDAQAITRTGPRTISAQIKKDGKVVRTAVREISADGQTLTLRFKGTNAKGQSLDDTWVFERKTDDVVVAVKAAVAKHWSSINRGDSDTVTRQHTIGMNMFMPEFDRRILLNSPAGLAAVRRLVDNVKPDWTPRDVEVQVLSPTSAVATFYMEGSASWKDGTVDSRPRRVTEVWVKENGTWKEAHHHDSVYVAAGKPATTQ